jgi:hypothetical protein
MPTLNTNDPAWQQFFAKEYGKNWMQKATDVDNYLKANNLTLPLDTHVDGTTGTLQQGDGGFSWTRAALTLAGPLLGAAAGGGASGGAAAGGGAAASGTSTAGGFLSALAGPGSSLLKSLTSAAPAVGQTAADIEKQRAAGLVYRPNSSSDRTSSHRTARCSNSKPLASRRTTASGVTCWRMPKTSTSKPRAISRSRLSAGDSGRRCSPATRGSWAA